MNILFSNKCTYVMLLMYINDDKFTSNLKKEYFIYK